MGIQVAFGIVPLDVLDLELVDAVPHEVKVVAEIVEFNYDQELGAPQYIRTPIDHRECTYEELDEMG